MITVVLHGTAGHLMGLMWVLLFLGLPVAAWRIALHLGYEDGYRQGHEDTFDDFTLDRTH